MASVISQLSILIRPISTLVLSLLFPSWPAHQKAVLRSFLSSPQAIFASLTMARDEMRIITELEISFLEEHSSKLWLYYADKDDWVGKERETIIRYLKEQAADRIVRDIHRTPHAFCIRGSIYLLWGCDALNRSTVHSELLATQCANWLRHGEFVEGQVVTDI